MAVLKHNSSIAENEVDGARDGAITVELAEGVGVESVLIGIKLAPVDHGSVAGDTESDGLVLDCTGRVLDAEVLQYQPVSIRSFMH